MSEPRSRGFERLPKPEPWQWLACYEEFGQSAAEYARSRPTGPTPERTTLVMQPLGPLSEEENALFRKGAEFCRAFLGIPVRIAPAILELDPSYGRPAEDGGREFRSPDLLQKVLQPRIPLDGIAVLGVTKLRLFRSEQQPVVLGESDYRRRMGVFSFALHLPDEDRQRALLRTCKVMAHETSHLLTIRHCIYYRRLMNGCKSVAELDGTPLYLCPICLEKLRWNLKFDPATRYREQIEFLRGNGLEEQGPWFEERLRRSNEV